MPLLDSGAERCAMPTGTYVVGGNGPDALPITALECCPAVATIVVPSSGESTIQRLTASVVVRLDRVPLGVAPKELHDGAQIEFGDCCLTFKTANAGEATITAGSDLATSGEWMLHGRYTAPAAAPAKPATRARIVNARTGDTIDLEHHRVVVGRDETCDFVVPGMRVSRRHFSVSPVQDGYLLRDESANGTIVNGVRVAGTYLLGHGDVVHLDEEHLRFELDGAAVPTPGADAAPTALLDLSYLRREYAADGKRDHSHAPRTASLEIVRGRYAGASFSIDRPVCAIGRSPQSDVRIRDESVSSDHATLLRKGSSWFVVDLRSANGTFVDGSRVAGERALPSGSRLKLGAVELMFRSLDGGDDRPDPTKPKRSWLRDLLRRFTQRTAETD
ncbi:MAG TPA: FHA domain-containing protein [Gemmatimonadaceae bacterium]|nr:FHA domain-containing protein [Gemmatimonadaceae bacterium]